MSRLDVELVSRGIFESRAKAAEAIATGNVFVNGKSITKPAFTVSEKDKIEAQKNEYVSRAAKKLEFALTEFGVDVSNSIAVDAGASTGGFTQVLLNHGAKQVYSVDVGTGQLHQSLKNNPKVENYEKTNFLDFDENILKTANIVVSDLSFVSQTLMAKKFAICLCPIIILIKPQFECGKDYARKHKGIVKDAKVHAECINRVVDAFENEQLFLQAIDVSPIFGGDGNKEFVALFQKNRPKQNISIEKIVENKVHM